MTYNPIEHTEGKKRYAIITPNPSGETKSVIVQIEHLSETLDEWKESRNKTYTVKIVDKPDSWVNQFQEL